MTTRAEAIARAGAILAAGISLRDSLPPREAAELAYSPSGPPLDELEDMIRAQRGLSPIHSTQRIDFAAAA